MLSPPSLFQCLKNPLFARLYTAQTINLIGDAFTWVGLALLAFELAGKNAALILSTALTMRVLVYAILSPLAGAIADRIDRKQIIVIAHLARMAIVSLLPFVSQPGQIYGVVVALSIFSAFFTPTYTATIPLVATKDEYPRAIALASATNQLLGVLGPGLAGSIAGFVGTRQIFFLDGITFLIAAILVYTLPGQLTVSQNPHNIKTLARLWQDIRTGTTCLFCDPLIRFALLMQLVGAIAGAAILVNTVAYIQGTLQLGKGEYGAVMAAFGLGATLTSVGLGSFPLITNKMMPIRLGALLLTLVLLPAYTAGLSGMLLLWLLAGTGQTLVNVLTQTLIADRLDVEVQGRVYGAQFAWSHFWWVFAYPLAGWLGGNYLAWAFLGSGLIGLALWTLTNWLWQPSKYLAVGNGLWHDHEHCHDEHHAHQHSSDKTQTHSHLHFHTAPK